MQRCAFNDLVMVVWFSEKLWPFTECFSLRNFAIKYSMDFNRQNPWKFLVECFSITVAQIPAFKKKRFVRTQNKRRTLLFFFLEKK